jgi:SAM-dependent methyltransferase
MFNFESLLSNYLGDYSPQNIDHKKYEQEVISEGAFSGEPLYDYCIKVIDEKFEKKPVKILDLACGKGPFGIRAKELGKNYIVDGIDLFVPEKDELVLKNVYNKVIEMDILNFNFPTVKDQYNLIVSNQFFEHLDPADSFNLLKKVSSIGASVLISVPLPYHTFAYSKDYLLSSLSQSEDFSDLVGMVTWSELHKTYFKSRVMSEFGFKTLPFSVYHSNFFYLEKNTLKNSDLEPQKSFKQVSKQRVEDTWKSLIKKYNPGRTSQPNRELYEKKLIWALLSEPISFKLKRKLIFLITHPIRLVLRLIRKNA